MDTGARASGFAPSEPRGQDPAPILVPVSDGRGAALLCSLLALAIALAVLVIQPIFPDLPIARLHAGYAAMVPGTAMPVSALALALLVLLSGGQRLQHARRRAQLAALIAAAVALYALGRLARSLINEALTGTGDRVSAATAIGVALIAAGVIGRTGLGSRREVVASVPATMAMVVSLVALSGYAFDAPRLHGFILFSGMSILTAISVFLLSFSVLLMGLQENWLRHLAGPDRSARMARLVLLPAVLGAFVLSALLLGAANRGYLTTNLSHALLADLLVVTGMTAILLLASNHAAEERRSKASLATLRNIIDATEVAALVTDEQGKVILANRMAEDLASESGGPALWLDKTPFFVPGSMEVLRDARHPRELARPDPEARRLLTAWMDSGGRMRSLRLYARTIPDGAGQGGLMTILTIIDETESWTAREDFSRIEKFEAMGLMAGGAAHEFANILGVIQLTADVGLMRSTGENHAHFDTIARACQRGEETTRRLLDLSRDNSAALAVHDVTEVLRGAPALLVPVLPEKLKLVLDLPKRPIRAICDRAELEAALLNLTLNAVHALAERPYAPPEIVLSLKADGGWMTIGLKDRGIGMDGEVRSLAAQPFFTTRGAKGGTGLGLSMVEAFARRLGGSMAIQSSRGEGTLVTLRLPLHDGPEDAAPEALGPAVPDLSGLSILVVENDPQFRQALPQALSLMGARVSVADNAVTALSMAAKQPFDLLLSDIRIEGPMNGLGLSTAIGEHFPKMARLLMTGFNDFPGKPREGQGAEILPLQRPEAALPSRAELLRREGEGPRRPSAPEEKSGVMILRKPLSFRTIANAIVIVTESQNVSSGAGRAKK